MGRKRTIGQIIRNKARERSITVAEIVRETGAKPNTVRVVLNQAASRGEIQITRFYVGHSARGIRAISHDEGIEARLDSLICTLCGSATK
jgi:hypothetical protein